MISVQRFEHKEFTSNTYIIKKTSSTDAFLVDIGEYKESKKVLNDLNPVALFITHAHYDHIYCINQFIQDYPDVTIYASEDCPEALADPKKNLSFYHEDPVQFEGGNFVTIPQMGIAVNVAGMEVEAFQTPGHNSTCASIQIQDYLFSGDSLIPGIDVVTKLRGGNKEKAKESVCKILNRMKDSQYLAPGHGPILAQKEVFKIYQDFV